MMKKLLIIIPIIAILGCSDNTAAKKEAMLSLVTACDGEGDVLRVSTTLSHFNNSMTVECTSTIKGKEE
jgi:hypothetical protein